MPLNREPRTPEQILRTVTAARDSVTVINQVLSGLASGNSPSLEYKRNLERNVGHLKLVVADPEVVNSGNNIDDLNAAIVAGDAKLAEAIWPAEQSRMNRLRP